MATIARTPFAPLDGARLQTLTSLKNRQNALSPQNGKRKAVDAVETDNSENVDPAQVSKRSKGGDSFFSPTKDILKPSSFVLTKAVVTPAPSFSLNQNVMSPVKAATPRLRTVLQPKSPAARLNTALAKNSPLSAPAGRSPTRGSKRVGLLSNRRRTASSFSRIDPPAFNLSAAAPFSLDAALNGTIPSYAVKPSVSTASSLAAGTAILDGSTSKSSWFFDIHEDSPEQEMTNLLQHSTCVLDISSDEESEQKARRERDEGRDKENVPPADDVSQTTRAALRALINEDDMMIEKARNPLGQLNAADFYAQGCDEASVIFIPGDDDDETVVGDGEEHQSLVAESFEFAPEIKTEAAPVTAVDDRQAIDQLMNVQTDDASAKAALLEPMEGTGESFELWESGSVKDEGEIAAAIPLPAPEADEMYAENCSAPCEL